MSTARATRARFPALVIWLAAAPAVIGCATTVAPGSVSSALDTSHQPAAAQVPPPPVPATESAPTAPEVSTTSSPSRAPASSRTSAPGEVDPFLPTDARERVVSVARRLLGKRQIRVDGRRYRSDCTGLVVGAFHHVGLEVFSAARPRENAVTSIFRYAQRRGRVFEGGRPLPGDLVFFRETYDVNRDGRANDGLTHVGIVEDVEPDGTVLFIHRVKRGVVRYRMNLARPDVRMDAKTRRVLNDYLRYSGLPGRRERLTGQLFAAYATILPTETSSMYSSAPSTPTGGGR